MKSYEEQIREMRELIEQHNRNKAAPDRLEPDGPIERLRREHPTEEHLNLLGYKELQDDFGLPEMLAKDIIRSWRGGIKVIVDTTPEAEAARLSLKELIDKYDPDDPTNAFGTRLSNIAGKDSKHKPNTFLIFDGDKLKHDATFKELERLRAGFPSRSSANYKGIPYKTFAVGERPARYKDQSPFPPYEALYDGESNAGFRWIDLPLETRQLVFIASTSNQADFQRYTEAELFTLLEGFEQRARDSSFNGAARLFPEAAIQFNELKRKGSLPSLKIPVGGDSSAATPAPSPSASSGSAAPSTPAS
jgi:hypothetical protein